MDSNDERGDPVESRGKVGGERVDFLYELLESFCGYLYRCRSREPFDYDRSLDFVKPFLELWRAASPEEIRQMNDLALARRSLTSSTKACSCYSARLRETLLRFCAFSREFGIFLSDSSVDCFLESERRLGTAPASAPASVPSRLEAFVYLLLRDCLISGELERLLLNLPRDGVACDYSNGYLASYARDVVERVLGRRS